MSSTKGGVIINRHRARRVLRECMVQKARMVVAERIECGGTTVCGAEMEGRGWRRTEKQRHPSGDRLFCERAISIAGRMKEWFTGSGWGCLAGNVFGMFGARRD